MNCFSVLNLSFNIITFFNGLFLDCCFLLVIGFFLLGSGFFLYWGSSFLGDSFLSGDFLGFWSSNFFICGSGFHWSNSCFLFWSSSNLCFDIFWGRFNYSVGS